MKIMMISPCVVLALGLFAGCSNNDSAKIDELTLKVDAMMKQQLIIYTNQAALCSELETVKRQVAALPSTKQMDAMAFYYHTNELTGVQSARTGVALILNRIDGCTAGIEFDVTNRMMADTIYTRLTVDDIDKELKTGDIAQDVFMINAKVDDVENDLRTIKNRLGIIY